MCVVAPHGPGHFLIRELRSDVSREIEVNQPRQNHGGPGASPARVCERCQRRGLLCVRVCGASPQLEDARNSRHDAALDDAR